MKVYCGSYNAPIRSVVIHLMQMSLVNMSTKFGYSRLIPSGDISHFIPHTKSFKRYIIFCSTSGQISHAYNFVSQLKQNRKDYQKSK
ncbi:hypothetical protein LDENG_00087500, partial [Lucifuga dentata]